MGTALLLIVFAGGMNGSFTVPMKRVRGWEWEHTWLVWAFLAMVVIPITVAVLTIPNLRAVYGAAGLGVFIRTAIFGMLWGASAVLFGLGVNRIGVALGFGIILGTASSLGALVPFLELHPASLFTTVGLLTLVGVAIVVAGVAACARAGILREAAPQRELGKRSFAVGAAICVLSGLGTTFMSVVLNNATSIYTAAESLGTPSARSLNAVWPVLLGGGFVVNAVYCAFLVVRRHNLDRFGQRTAANFGLALLMAALWAGSNFSYGAGARAMGSLGLILGWPIFMAAIVLAANAWGGITGEWRQASCRSISWAGIGNLLLVAGIAVIAYAGRT